MILIGLIILFLVSISPKNINSLITNLFKIFKRKIGLLLAILLTIFGSLILSYLQIFTILVQF